MKTQEASLFTSHKKVVLSVLFFVGLFLLQTEHYSQVKIPGTPAGKRLTEFVELINVNDKAAIEKYVNENLSLNFISAIPVERHVGMINQIHDNMGKIVIHEIESSEDYHIKGMLLSSSTNNLLSFDMTLEEKEPYKIDRLGFRPGGSYTPQADEQKPETKTTTDKGKKSSTISKITASELKSSIDSYIDSLVEKNEFSGTVLIAQEGKPIYTKAVGFANKGFNVLNKLNTKFCLASMNKMFTGTAIMQLVQEGKLNLTDKVGKYLPDYPNDDVRNKVTIHQLLTHTSGMGLYWKEFFDSPKIQEIITVADYDNLANKNPLLFEPGERFSYSNCGPLVLGLIIEKISGMSYDEYIRKYVTGPSGMINTDYYDISMPIENLAIGYTDGRMLGRSYNPRRNNLFISPVKGGPAGGGYSTVEDLLKFDIALRNNKLLNEENFKLMTTGKVDRNAKSKYAYLFMEKYVNDERIIGHSGGAGGINSNLSMYMNSGYTVAIMSNYDPPAAENIVSKIEGLLTQ